MYLMHNSIDRGATRIIFAVHLGVLCNTAAFFGPLPSLAIGDKRLCLKDVD